MLKKTNEEVKQPETEQLTVENAFIMSEDLGKKVIEFLLELPHKYRDAGMLLEELLEKTPRGTINLTIQKRPDEK